MWSDNIPRWISLCLCCDSAFAHKKKFSIFKFPERFLEISTRDLTLFIYFNQRTIGLSTPRALLPLFLVESTSVGYNDGILCVPYFSFNPNSQDLRLGWHIQRGLVSSSIENGPL